MIVAAILVLAAIGSIAASRAGPTGNAGAAGTPAPGLRLAAPPGATQAPSPSASATSPADDPARAAWGQESALAKMWSAVVPPDPAKPGSLGQECHAQAPDTPYASNEILCAFPDGEQLSLLGYRTGRDRNLREAQIASSDGVLREHRDMRDLNGDLIGGTFYEQPHAISRWWVLDDDQRSAVVARWPGHTLAQLGRWWDRTAPFI